MVHAATKRRQRSADIFGNIRSILRFNLGAIFSRPEAANTTAAAIPIQSGQLPVAVPVRPQARAEEPQRANGTHAHKFVFQRAKGVLAKIPAGLWWVLSGLGICLYYLIKGIALVFKNKYVGKGFAGAIALGRALITSASTLGIAIAFFPLTYAWSWVFLIAAVYCLWPVYKDDTPALLNKLVTKLFQRETWTWRNLKQNWVYLGLGAMSLASTIVVVAKILASFDKMYGPSAEVTFFAGTTFTVLSSILGAVAFIGFLANTYNTLVRIKEDATLHNDLKWLFAPNSKDLGKRLLTLLFLFLALVATILTVNAWMTALGVAGTLYGTLLCITLVVRILYSGYAVVKKIPRMLKALEQAWYDFREDPVGSLKRFALYCLRNPWQTFWALLFITFLVFNAFGNGAIAAWGLLKASGFIATAFLSLGKTFSSWLALIAGSVTSAAICADAALRRAHKKADAIAAVDKVLRDALVDDASHDEPKHGHQHIYSLLKQADESKDTKARGLTQWLRLKKQQITENQKALARRIYSYQYNIYREHLAGYETADLATQIQKLASAVTALNSLQDTSPVGPQIRALESVKKQADLLLDPVNKIKLELDRSRQIEAAYGQHMTNYQADDLATLQQQLPQVIAALKKIVDSDWQNANDPQKLFIQKQIENFEAIARSAQEDNADLKDIRRQIARALAYSRKSPYSVTKLQKNYDKADAKASADVAKQISQVLTEFGLNEPEQSKAYVYDQGMYRQHLAGYESADKQTLRVKLANVIFDLGLIHGDENDPRIQSYVYQRQVFVDIAKAAKNPNPDLDDIRKKIAAALAEFDLEAQYKAGETVLANLALVIKTTEKVWSENESTRHELDELRELVNIFHGESATLETRAKLECNKRKLEGELAQARRGIINPERQQAVDNKLQRRAKQLDVRRAIREDLAEIADRIAQLEHHADTPFSLFTPEQMCPDAKQRALESVIDTLYAGLLVEARASNDDRELLSSPLSGDEDTLTGWLAKKQSEEGISDALKSDLSTVQKCLAEFDKQPALIQRRFKQLLLLVNIAHSDDLDSWRAAINAQTQTDTIIDKVSNHGRFTDPAFDKTNCGSNIKAWTSWRSRSKPHCPYGVQRMWMRLFQKGELDGRHYGMHWDADAECFKPGTPPASMRP